MKVHQSKQKTVPSTGNVMVTVFKVAHGVILETVAYYAFLPDCINSEIKNIAPKKRLSFFNVKRIADCGVEFQ